MKIVAVSDMHGTLPSIEPCDLLLIAGDSMPVWDHKIMFQLNWARSTFTEWLKAVPAKHIVGIAGNHDFIFERNPEVATELPWTYLYDSGTTVEGLKIWGSPWCNKFGGKWAFMLPEGMLIDKYKMIPRDVDIIVSHGPPNGFGDAVPRYVWKNGEGFKHCVERTGSSSFANQLHYETWENLKLIVFGHIHEGYGISHSSKGVKMANVSCMNEHYDYDNPNPPAVFNV